MVGRVLEELVLPQPVITQASPLNWLRAPEGMVAQATVALVENDDTGNL